MTPEQFAAKYAGVRLNETALYVSHFNDLRALVGHPQPVEMDRVGETFTFQKGVTKNAEGQIVGRGWRTKSSTGRCWTPTAGRTTSATTRFWRGCWRRI